MCCHARAKWSEAEDLHLTLRFLGDIAETTATDFVDLIREPGVAPFQIRLQGIGCFGGRQPRVIWAGAETGDGLDRLAQAHERAARHVGLEPDPRPFKPHVTLARLRGTRPEAVAAFLGDHGAFSSEPFEVDRFVLFSARPHTGGGPYVVEETFALAGALIDDAPSR